MIKIKISELGFSLRLAYGGSCQEKLPSSNTQSGEESDCHCHRAEVHTEPNYKLIESLKYC